MEAYPAGIQSRAGERVRATIEQAFAAYPSFGSGPRGPLVPARIEIRVFEGDTPTLSLRAAVPAPEGLQSVLPGGLDTRVDLERDDGPVDLGRDLPLAADRLAGAIETKLALARGDVDAIIAALRSDDPNRVVLALDWIRTHRLRRYADAVVVLLEHPESAVTLAAVDCIGAIGSAEHARALVGSIRLWDRAHAHRVYDALSRVGGPDAIGFLRFAARNEEDGGLRVAAQTAVRRLETEGARAAGPGSMGSSSVRRGHR